MNIFEQIDGLIKQATEEDSRFYIADVLKSVKEKLVNQDNNLSWYNFKHEQRRNQVYDCMDEIAGFRIEIADLTAQLQAILNLTDDNGLSIGDRPDVKFIMYSG